jgi:hypothetical protein
LEEYYPLDQGNIWVYFLEINDNGEKNESQEIRKVKGIEVINGIKTKKIASLKSDNQCVAIDKQGVKSYKYYGWPNNDYEVYLPAKILFPNIELGKSITTRLDSIIYDIRDIEDESLREAGILTVRLVSLEEVIVPAGVFKDCLKFISIYDYKQVNKPLKGKETIITWLAPGIGMVKSQYITYEYDLDTKKEKKITETLTLKQALVNGKDVPAGASSIIYHRDPPR